MAWSSPYFLAFLIVPVITARSLFAADYYFSESGSDQNGNGTLADPWRTINKFNSLDLNPGDNVYFRAAETFHGSLVLDQMDTGTDATGALISPVRIGSYGEGTETRAVIQSPPTASGLLAENNGGFELRNLEFVNGGSYASNPNSGINLKVDLTSSGGLSHLQHVRVDNVVSRGFHRSGLSISANASVGYRDVEVTNSQFYDNQFAGIEIAATAWTDLLHQDVRIDGVIARDNPGFSGCSPHCGHGIVLGQVDGAIVQNSVANSNGSLAGKGNVGIWAWQSNNVVIQRNTAAGNRSPLGGDGGGFDIDGGVTNSIVQYNISQDNAGAGYLVAEFAFAEPMQQNIYRYNLSVNDGIDGYGAFTIWGEDAVNIASSALIHNNTAIVDQSAAPGSRGTVWFINENHSDIALINNAFVALNGAKLIDGTTSVDKARFVNNAYWTEGAPVQIESETFGSVEDWAGATQQEQISGQFQGIESDPRFDNGGYFRPVPPSELVDRGLPLASPAWPAWFSGLGSTDLYGVSLPLTSAVDIGAAEYPSLPGDYNGDSRVDGADYTVWRDTLSAIGPALHADGNRNGIVDAGDYELWKAYFGNAGDGPQITLGTASTSKVPELASAFLWFVAYVTGHLNRFCVLAFRSN